eukprot:Clim_evm4s238 gene=Clim_evmTU4s238
MSDTNLKKSWHPHAAKSRARLERAEQAHQEEQRKIQEWRREQEIAEENAQLKRSAENAGLKADRPERLDWMYEHSGVDSQEKETVENYSPSYKKSASLAKQSAKDSNKPSTDLLLGHKSLDKAAISSISQADPSSKVADDPAEDRRQQRLALEDPMALMMQAPTTGQMCGITWSILAPKEQPDGSTLTNMTHVTESRELHTRTIRDTRLLREDASVPRMITGIESAKYQNGAMVEKLGNIADAGDIEMVIVAGVVAESGLRVIVLEYTHNM